MNSDQIEAATPEQQREVLEARAYELLVAFGKAADDAANWIVEARDGARKEGCWDVLPPNENVPVKDTGKPEVAALRKAIRDARKLAAAIARREAGE